MQRWIRGNGLTNRPREKEVSCGDEICAAGYLRQAGRVLFSRIKFKHLFYAASRTLGQWRRAKATEDGEYACASESGLTCSDSRSSTILAPP